jgi:hypothetical protein
VVLVYCWRFSDVSARPPDVRFEEISRKSASASSRLDVRAPLSKSKITP